MSEPGPGHNSVAGDQLKAFVERIENLEEEKKALSDDIKDVYNEAAGTGFDKKALRQIVALRKMDANERMARDAVIDLYLRALDMI